MIRARYLFAAAAWVLLLAPLVDARAYTFTAGVVRVIDGDTLELDDGRVVRLAIADAPERNQPCGNTAAAVLDALVGGRDIAVRVVGRSWGRLVGMVHVVPGVGEVNWWMVRAGFAWRDARYDKSPAPSVYATGEQLARAHRAGCFMVDNPIAPWDWRAGNRGP